MADPMESLQKGDAVLVVDVQTDFCPGGALPVDQGDKVVSVLNSWIEAAEQKGVPVYASRDLHPAQHMSFSEHGGEWPAHCVQDTEGAGFHPDLKLPESVVKIAKGTRFDKDQYSVFDQTGLAEQLRRDGVERLWVGGLALDVCVLASVLDARSAGFDVYVLEKATRPVTVEGGKQALRKMHEAGVYIIV